MSFRRAPKMPRVCSSEVELRLGFRQRVSTPREADSTNSPAAKYVNDLEVSDPFWQLKKKSLARSN